MLVQFMLKNVLSFKEEAVLDMSAVNAYKEHEDNLVEMDNGEKFLRVAAVYGANASGKSNLYYAFYYFRKIVSESFNNVDERGISAIAQYYMPFAFESDKENSEYQIVEIIDGFEYKYGFEFNDERIVSEWLYRKNLKTKRNTIIFEREGSDILLGASVRKECEVYTEQIPMETLMLSFFNKLKLKTEVFKKVYDGIRDIFVLSPGFYEDKGLLKDFLPGAIEYDKESLLNFLTAIDTGIKGIGYDKKDDYYDFYTIHIGKDGGEYKLSLFDESAGTVKSILIFLSAHATLMYDKVMFVDELNIKLHPLLLKFIVDLFYDQRSSAQLIYTTHDTTLLDKKFIRRDQVWFVQKDEFGYSELSALSDFRIRSDASFEKDYLAGVYGGIPLIKEIITKEGE